MSDPRKPIVSILLKKSGKTTQINLYDFAEFSGQFDDDIGLYRVRINGRWHSPAGKYTPFSPKAVSHLVEQVLLEETEKPIPKGLRRSVRVFAHWEPEHDDDPGCGTAWTLSPPFVSVDGRWYIWIDGPRMVRCDDVRVLTQQENITLNREANERTSTTLSILQGHKQSLS